MASKSIRVRPNETVLVGKSKVTNKTGNSITVSSSRDGTVRVTDCCLEEQGK
jgi:hypothetical protein